MPTSVKASLIGEMVAVHIIPRPHVNVDQVLCHDRVLPAEALTDPERAARAADRALRLDADELQAA